jgi:uncharacterized protein (TIGR03435 family)
MYAYGVPAYQVSGPDWIKTETYDIWARLPAGSKKESIPGMVRELLSERFRMTSHWSTQEERAYSLVQRQSGAKLQRAPDDASTRVSFSGPGYYSGRAVSLQEFCNVLAASVGRPVIDQTGLEGRFNILIQLSELTSRSSALQESSSMSEDRASQLVVGGVDGTSTFSGLRDLGLELKNIKTLVKHLVIDSVSKEFTPN